MEYKILNFAQHNRMSELENYINDVAKEGWRFCCDIAGSGWLLFERERWMGKMVNYKDYTKKMV